ncbi:cytochrome P450 [Mycena galericulata]|nr:cytochrome P450 [Mycena galericulata]
MRPFSSGLFSLVRLIEAFWRFKAGSLVDFKSQRLRHLFPFSLPTHTDFLKSGCMGHGMSYTTAAALSIVLALYFLTRGNRGIRTIVGPPSPSWVFGHMLQLLLAPQYGDYEFKWLKQFGAVYRLKGCFGQDRLMVSDPLALQYILNSAHFDHAPVMKNLFNILYGKTSVVALEGEMHRRVRTPLNNGFTASAVRNYQPLFEKAAQKVTEQLEKASRQPVDVCPLLSNATLSAFSEAVLGYSTKELGGDFLENNYKILQAAGSQAPNQVLSDAIGAKLPTRLLEAAFYLPTATLKAVRESRRLADRIGHRIVQEKLDAARKGLEINDDVYSLLLNPRKSDKTGRALSTEEIVDQTALLLIAGQDTTANTLAFSLLELAKNPDLQTRLRAEIHSMAGEGGRNVASDSIPLLNAFIKEALRLYPAAPMIDRIPIEDMVLPLSESLVTSNGEHISQIPIRKGQVVTVAIASYQRLESRWGADAHEFKPSRWIEGTAYRGEAIGPYANLLSFMSGAHTCLGWRFAIMEMQVLLCELVGKFSFSLPEEDSRIVRTRLSNTIFPTDSAGNKTASLLVTRIL